jgi:hypothetical protein
VLGSRSHFTSVLQGNRKSAKIHVRSGAIWGIPVYDPKDHEEILRRKIMLPKTVITALAPAAVIAGTAFIPTGASARGAPHGGGWSGPPIWTWPYIGPRCEWVQVKNYRHKRAYWQWVNRCQ